MRGKSLSTKTKILTQQEKTDLLWKINRGWNNRGVIITAERAIADLNLIISQSGPQNPLRAQAQQLLNEIIRGSSDAEMEDEEFFDTAS